MLLLLSLLPLAHPLSTWYNGGCNATQFDCDDGSCVPNVWVFDNIWDCKDGRDEEHRESHHCPDDKMLCKNGDCVAKQLRCDGVANCDDGSDEWGCGRENHIGSTPLVVVRAWMNNYCARIRHGWLACGSSFDDIVCIPAELRCDGKEDCDDGTDESNCHLPLNDCPRGSQFHSVNGSVVCLPPPLDLSTLHMTLHCCLAALLLLVTAAFTVYAIANRLRR